MKLWDAILGLLVPSKYLHNRSLRDSDAHERQRHSTNTELAKQAFALAEKGNAVGLKCTNSGWVELRVMPNEKSSFTYNGRSTDATTELERRH